MDPVCGWQIPFHELRFFFSIPACKMMREATTKRATSLRKDIRATPVFQARVAKEISARDLEKDAQDIETRIQLMLEAVRDEREVLKAVKQGVQDLRSLSLGKPCLRPECSGFLNGQLECSACFQIFCKDCETPAHPGGPCDEANKASIKAIKSICKPCPGCGNQTVHVSGCNDVWCRSCNTHFDYRTGKRTAFAHNPDYEEYGGTRALVRAFTPKIAQVMRKVDQHRSQMKIRRLLTQVYNLSTFRPRPRKGEDPFLDHLIDGAIGTCAKGKVVSEAKLDRLLKSAFRKKEKEADDLKRRQAFLQDASVLLHAYLEPTGSESTLEDGLLERIIFHDVKSQISKMDSWGLR